MFTHVLVYTIYALQCLPHLKSTYAHKNTIHTYLHALSRTRARAHTHTHTHTHTLTLTLTLKGLNGN